MRQPVRHGDPKVAVVMMIMIAILNMFAHTSMIAMFLLVKRDASIDLTWKQGPLLGGKQNMEIL